MADKQKKVVVKVTSSGLKPVLKDLKQLNTMAKGTKKVKLEVNRTHLKSSISQALAIISKTGGTSALKVNATINKTLFRSSMLSQIKLLEKRGINLRARVTGRGTTRTTTQGANLGSNLGIAAGAGLQKDTKVGVQTSIKAFEQMESIFRKMDTTFSKQNRQMNLLNRNMEMLTRGIADLVGALVSPAAKTRILRQVAVGKAARQQIHKGEGYLLNGAVVSREQWKEQLNKDPSVRKARKADSAWTLRNTTQKGTAKSSKSLQLAIEKNTGATASNSKAVRTNTAKAPEKSNYGRNRAVAGNVNRGAKGFSLMNQGGVDAPNSLVGVYADIAAKVFAIGAAFRALKSAGDMTVLIGSMEAYGNSTNINLVNITKNLQKAVDMTVDFKQAAQTTTLATAAGFDAGQIQKMGEAAKMAALALGRDMGDALDRLTRGVVKAEPEVLDELGIILRLEPATKKYAEMLGKTAKELTTFEKSQAVLNEVLTQTEEKFGNVGKSVESNPFGRLEAQMMEMGLRLGEGINTLISPIINGILAVPQLLVAAFATLLGFLAKNTLKNPMSKILGKGTPENSEQFAKGYSNKEKAYQRLMGQKLNAAKKTRAMSQGKNHYSRTSWNSSFGGFTQGQFAPEGLMDRDANARFVAAENRSLSRNTKLKWEAVKAQKSLNKVKHKAVANYADSELSQSKTQVDKQTGRGVSKTRAFLHENRKMRKNISTEYSEMHKTFDREMNRTAKNFKGFGKGGFVDKSLLHLQMGLKTSTLALYTFGSAIKGLAMGALAAFAIVPMIGAMLDSASKALGLSKISTDEYADSTESLVNVMDTQAIAANNVAGAMLEADGGINSQIRLASLAANAYSSMSDALSENVTKLQEWQELGTGWGAFWDDVLDIATLGLSETQFDAARDSLEALTFAAAKHGMTLQDLGTDTKDIEDATGFWSGSEAKMLKVLQKGDKALKKRTLEFKNLEAALKSMKDVSKELGKAWSEVTTAFSATPYDKFAELTERMSKDLKAAASAFDSIYSPKEEKKVELSQGASYYQSKYNLKGDTASSLDTPEAKKIIKDAVSEHLYSQSNNGAMHIMHIKALIKRSFDSQNNIVAKDNFLLRDFTKLKPALDAAKDSKELKTVLSKLNLQQFTESWVGLAKHVDSMLKGSKLSIALEGAETHNEAKVAVEALQMALFNLRAEYSALNDLAAKQGRLSKIYAPFESAQSVSEKMTHEDAQVNTNIKKLEHEKKLAEASLLNPAKELSQAKREEIRLGILKSGAKIQAEQAKLHGLSNILLNKNYRAYQNTLDIKTKELELDRSLLAAQEAAGTVSKENAVISRANHGSTKSFQDYTNKAAKDLVDFENRKKKLYAETGGKNPSAQQTQDRQIFLQFEEARLTKKLDLYLAQYKVEGQILRLAKERETVEVKSNKMAKETGHYSATADLHKEIYDFGVLHTDSQKTRYDLQDRTNKLEVAAWETSLKYSLAQETGNKELQDSLSKEAAIVSLKQKKLRVEKEYLSLYIDLNAQREAESALADKALDVASKEYEFFNSINTLTIKKLAETASYQKKYLSIEQKIKNVKDTIVKAGDDLNTKTLSGIELSTLQLEQQELFLVNRKRILDTFEDEHKLTKEVYKTDSVFTSKESASAAGSAFSDEMHYRFVEFQEDFRDSITFAADLWEEAFLDPIDRMAENLKGDNSLYGEDGYNEFWNDTWRGLGDQLIDQGASEIKQAMLSDFEKDKLAKAEAIAAEQLYRAKESAKSLVTTASLLASIDHRLSPQVSGSITNTITAIADLANPFKTLGMEVLALSNKFKELTTGAGVTSTLGDKANKVPNTFAAGGHIAGPGGPKEDKIPAWLSNGEYVINAAATKKHQGLIEAINEDRVPRFSEGGPTGKYNMRSAKAIFDGRFSKGVTMQHYPADKWRAGEVSGTKNGVKGSLTYTLDKTGTKVTSISMNAPKGGPNSLQLLNKLLNTNPNISQIDPLETSTGSKFADKKGYGINKRVNGGTQALNSWKSMAALHGVNVLETIGEQEARGAFGKPKATQSSLFKSNQGFDQKWLKGAGHQPGLPGVDSKNVYSDKWKKQFVKDLANVNRGTGQLDLFPQGQLPFKGAGIPRSSGPSMRANAARFGKSFLKWGLGPAGIGLSIAELIDWYMESNEEQQSVMDSVPTKGINPITMKKFSNGGKAANENYKNTWGIDKDANKANQDYWTNFGLGASAAKFAEFLMNSKGMGKGWLPNGMFESAFGSKGSTGAWWKAGKMPFGLQGSFMGAKPTMGGTVGLVGLAGWGGFELGRLLSPDADKYWTEEAENGYSKTKGMFGFANGGLASRGRNGDTELAHVNKSEKALLRALGGSATRNPSTGLVEYAGGDPEAYISPDKAAIFKDLYTAAEAQVRYLSEDAATTKLLIGIGEDGKISEAEKLTISADSYRTLNSILTSIEAQATSRAELLGDASRNGFSKEDAEKYAADNSAAGTDFLNRQAKDNEAAGDKRARDWKMNNSDFGKLTHQFGIEMTQINSIAAGSMKMALGEALRTGKFEWKTMLSSIAFSIGNVLMSKAVDTGVDLLVGAMFANGGVAAGGFKAFANGGLVNKPTLGLVGEGKHNEAIVPLPDGKSIPVIQNTPPGGSGGEVYNNVAVTINMEQGTAKAESSSSKDNGGDIEALGDMIAGQVQQVLMEEKRPGGILSEI